MSRPIAGMNVIITGRSPKMRVSAEFARIQDPDLVARTNAWMAEFFGYVELLPDGQMIYSQLDGSILMNATTYGQVMKTLQAAG